MQFDDAAMHLDAHRGFVGQPLLAHKAHKAARAIAAVLHLAAIGVVDDVLEIHTRLRRSAHAQNLVRSNTKMAIGQPAVLGRAQPQATAGFVQHDEIVAGTLHLGETDVHGASLSGHADTLSPMGVRSMDSHLLARCNSSRQQAYSTPADAVLTALLSTVPLLPSNPP